LNHQGSNYRVTTVYNLPYPVLLTGAKSAISILGDRKEIQHSATTGKA